MKQITHSSSWTAEMLLIMAAIWLPKKEIRQRRADESLDGTQNNADTNIRGKYALCGNNC